MTKVTEVLKRQGALVRKIAAGTATDDEKAEALKLQEALDAAAAEATPPATASMTLAEFKKLAEADLAALEKAPDEERLARLRRNLKSIRDQGKVAPDEIVTVEVEAKAAEPSILDSLDAAVDAAAKAHSFDGRTRSGVREAPPVAPTKDDEEEGKDKAKKDDAPAPFDKATVSGQLAVEALDALTAKVNALRTAVASGAVDRETFEEAFEGWWDLRSAIETYCRISGCVTPGAEAPEAPPAAAALSETPPEAPTKAEDATPEPPAKAEETAAEPPAETAKAAWRDLSPRLGAEEGYRELRRGAMRHAGRNRATT